MRVRTIIFVALFFLVVPFSRAIFLGTTDGYIFNMTGNLVSGANVDVVVSGCSGSGCSASTTSDSGGYYVVANLNLNSGGTVTSTATYGGASGSASGTANSFMAARVNVTLCAPPTTPVLTTQADTHINDVTLYWTSGTDPNGLSTYDQFQFDSNPPITATSPQTESNLDYTAYTWQVRTCNTNGVTGCCSPFASSSFTITNSAPSAPVLQSPNITSTSSATLNWTSGVDPDGDTVNDEFEFSNDSFSTLMNDTVNSTHPVAVSNLVINTEYYWRIRSCDFLVCSTWSSGSFNITNLPPSSPVLVHQPPTNETSVTLNWTSGVDPESDTTNDELQVSTSSNFSSIFFSSNNAASGTLVSGLSTLTTYFWRVRTCDFVGCSDYSSDYFFVYPITSCPPAPACVGGGGGGGHGGTVYITYNCTPTWRCGDWSGCSSGVMTRACYDTNNCAHAPDFITSCAVLANITKNVSVSPEFMGDLDYQDIYDLELPTDRQWYFTFKKTNHTMKLLNKTDDSVDLLIESPIRLTMKKYETRIVDINGDGVSDVAITLKDIKDKSIVVTMVKVLPSQPTPALEKPVVVQLGQMWIPNVAAYAVAIAEAGLLIYFYLRTRIRRKP